MKEKKLSAREMVIQAFVKYRPKTAIAKIVKTAGISAGTKIAYKLEGEILVVNTISSFYRIATVQAIEAELENLKVKGKEFEERVELLSLIFDKSAAKIKRIFKTGEYES